jgi:hypothetical protein
MLSRSGKNFLIYPILKVHPKGESRVIYKIKNGDDE